jgi:hypothetical protein
MLGSAWDELFDPPIRPADALEGERPEPFEPLQLLFRQVFAGFCRGAVFSIAASSCLARLFRLTDFLCDCQ